MGLCRPGELVFVSDYVLHAVVNLADSVALNLQPRHHIDIGMDHFPLFCDGL